MIGLRRILGDTGWLTLERVARMGVNLVVSVWLARYLGSEAFGTYSYVIATVLLFSEVATLGLNAILVRDLVGARTPEEEREILGTAFWLRIGGGAGTLLLATTLVAILRPDDAMVRTLVLVFAAGFAFRASDVVNFFFQSRTSNRPVVLARSAAFFTTSAGIVFAIVAGAPLAAFVAIRASEFALTAIGFAVAYFGVDAPAFARWRFSPSRAGEMLARSWPLILSGLGSVVYLKIDQIMLADVIGDAAVGIYAVAAQLSEVWYFLPQALCIAVFPSLLQARDRDPEAYERRLQMLYDVLAMSGIAISIPVALLAGPVIDLLYGAEYQGAGAVLSIHIWASVFIFMRAGLSKWLVAEDLYVFSLVTHGAGAIVNVGLNLWLIPRYGPIGAAIATVISYAVASYFSLLPFERTRSAARKMTLALAFPLRWIARR